MYEIIVNLYNTSGADESDFTILAANAADDPTPVVEDALRDLADVLAEEVDDNGEFIRGMLSSERIDAAEYAVETAWAEQLLAS